MVYNPPIKEKRSKNVIILAGIIGTIAVGVAYGIVSGAFSSAGPPTVPSAPQNEEIIMHIHPTIKIIIEGKSVTIPQNIGINAALYKSHDLDAYGMKNQRMSPLHTHDSSGVIHVESTQVRTFTLGEFFDVWGVTFTDSCIMDKCNDDIKTVKMFVDGQPSTEFKDHTLRDEEQISVEYG